MKIVPENLNEMSIKHLSPKTAEDIEKYYNNHPNKAFNEVCENDDVNIFIKLLKKGIKLTSSHIKILYSFHKRWDEDNANYIYTSFILKWLNENLDSLHNYNISEKLIRDLRVAFKADNTKKTSHPKEYPRGYKQWRVLSEIRDSKEGKTRSEIIKLIYELGYGANTYNSFKNVSYWSEGFVNILGPYIDSTPEKTFVINQEGIEKIKKLDKRFKNLNVNALV